MYLLKRRRGSRDAPSERNLAGHLADRQKGRRDRPPCAPLFPFPGCSPHAEGLASRQVDTALRLAWGETARRDAGNRVVPSDCRPCKVVLERFSQRERASYSTYYSRSFPPPAPQCEAVHSLTGNLATPGSRPRCREITGTFCQWRKMSRLSPVISAPCPNHRLRLCARRRWLRDRSRSRLSGDGAANVDHNIRPNFRHSNYLWCGISYVARPPRYRGT